MSIVTLITTLLEAGIAIFSFFTKRAARNDALKQVMDEFSKKHDSTVQENIKLRLEYEKLKQKIADEKKV